MNQNKFGQNQNNNMMNQKTNFQNLNNMNNMNNMMNFQQGFNNMANNNKNMFNFSHSFNPAFNMNMNNIQIGNMNNNMKINNNQSININVSNQKNFNMNNMQMQAGNNMKSNININPNNMINNNNLNKLNNNMNIPPNNAWNKINNNMNMINNNFNNNNMNKQNNMGNQNNIIFQNNMNMQNNNIKNMNIFPNQGVISNNMKNNNLQVNVNNRALNNMNVNINNLNNLSNMNNFNNQNNKINIPNNNNNNIKFGGINYDFMKNNNIQNMNNNTDNNDINNLEEKLKSLFKSCFPNSVLQTLQTENSILSQFSLGEQKCFDFIELNMPSKRIYINYISQELTNLFNNSPVINHGLTQQICFKITSIPFQSFLSTQEYYDKLKTIFGNVNVPKFLIKKDLESLEGLLKYINRKNKTTTIINDISNNKYENTNSKIIIECLNKMKNNTMQPLKGIDKRYELFKLFLCENRMLFNKKYIDSIFLNFIDWNIDLIRFYFGNNINLQEIKQFILDLNTVNTSNQNIVVNQENIIFRNISLSIANNINLICNIISSFYFILIYKFKNIYNNITNNNIDNSHLFVALKNFVIFLDQNCPNYSMNGINLFKLLTDLISYDVNCLVKFDYFYKEKNKEYNFKDIDFLLQDNSRYNELKKSDILTYKNDLDDGVFTLIKKNFWNNGYLNEYELYFKLKPIDKEVLSNSVTILIDGGDFLTINDKFDWNQFIEKFNGETNFYELCWPNKISDALNKTNVNKKERELKFKAKTCGKLLGYILFSEKFFDNYQINLVGLNYGCFIVKNCLKELKNLKSIENKKIFIKNVVFINGSINIRNEINWTEIFQNLIVDKIINCFSKKDNVNELLKKNGLSKDTIGTKGLGINNIGKNYLKYDHNLTDFEFGKEFYDLSIPSKVSFASYNDL